ncbi:2-hydroxy-3-oxopropionate reductase [Streptomyces sp. S4.7]|uniref:NAD(P)-dependent oxidoreductase n=1 Tax=Streptomyces sp. S4.7 TaxID=2705439 RepID=UPI00139758BC|nr:NAD(P)-binding domain-containing protein [Streptomyces sp. S4.7]QHY96980.1 2-hydroxy-3-oxopropionate reductase [Streptomyces sp. S4.7]
MNAAAPVTVLGLGLMGQALAEALLREGHATTVWNRTAAKAEPLVAKGAELADSVADAVAASQLVIICVLDYDAVHGLLDPVAGSLDGRVLVNLTSGTSEGARETARWAAGHGATYLDGAILTDPDGVGTADAVVLYSGPRATFDAHEPTLRLFGGAATHLGDDHGLSSLYDVAVLGMMWGVLNSFLQGAAVLGAAGVDASVFAPLAAKSVKMIADWVPGYAEQIDKGAYPAVDATLNTHLASMNHLVHESEFLGVSAEFPKFVRALAERSVANGHGTEGYASMIELFREP